MWAGNLLFDWSIQNLISDSQDLTEIESSFFLGGKLVSLLGALICTPLDVGDRLFSDSRDSII